MKTLHTPEIDPTNGWHVEIEITRILIGDRETRRVNDRPEMNDSGNDWRNNQHPEKIPYPGNNEEKYRRQQTPLHQLPQSRYKKTAYRRDHITTRTLSNWHHISLSIIHQAITCLLYRHFPPNVHSRCRPHRPPFSFRGFHSDCLVCSDVARCR